MTKTNDIAVKILLNDKGSPASKLADAELYFSNGPLEGLRLLGFAVWQTRGGGRKNVTFPARTYSVNGERRSFALLRPVDGDPSAQNNIRDLILAAYDNSLDDYGAAGEAATGTE